MTTSATNNHRAAHPVVGALAGKVVEPTDVSRSKKALLSVNEGSLYFPIFYHNEEIGGIFIGTGQVLFDAIIETKRGAFGKSHEFLWNGSLLLLTMDGKWSPPSVQPIQDKDLTAFHITSVEDANRRAQEIFHRFKDNNRDWVSGTFIQRQHGWIATILDVNRGKCGIIASDDRLVVTIGDLKLVISGNKLVQKQGRKKVVVAGRGGPVLRFG